MHDDSREEPIDVGIVAGFGSPPQEPQEEQSSGDKDTGRRLGDFDVQGELGRGGMGIVYEARQLSLNRKVALKVLGTGLGMTARAVLRFRKEAEAAAKLHHTNIVPIYATGEAEGTHFYAMELIEGPSLNLVIQQMRRQRAGDTPDGAPVSESQATVMPDWVAQTLCPDGGSSSRGTGNGRQLSESSTLTTGSNYVDTVARMIAEVADGLDYAHNHGVVHRDMKPSNLLLSPDGRLSINDFGLARMMEQPGMTMTGEFVGSPLYMSPEQIAVGRAPLDHRTDIYSLGATLYELLTLEPPFPGQHRDQVIAQIMHKEPTRPRRINAKIPVDLETICLKAMEKDPDQRYQTAALVAEDLRRYVNRFAISAKRTGVLNKTTKWIRRHPAVAGLLVLVLASVVMALLANNRLKAEMLDRRMDEALLHSMSGDFERAQDAIHEAGTLGASDGWLLTLEGQLFYFQGKDQEAVGRLEAAATLEPDNVATQALLVLALQNLGNWDRYYKKLRALDNMLPSTRHEHLVKGLALLHTHPAPSAVDLNKAVEGTPSSIAYAIRGYAFACLAEETHDLDHVRAALDDLRLARGLDRSNPIVLSNHLLGQVAAAKVYRARGMQREMLEALAVAEDDFAGLEDSKNLSWARWARVAYLEASGQDDLVLYECREALRERAGYGSIMWSLVAELYGRGEWPEALEVLDAWEELDGPTDIDMYRAYILAESSTNREEVAQLIQDGYTPHGAGLPALHDSTVLVLLGEREQAIDAARRSLDLVSNMPEWMFARHQYLVDYLCGDLTSQELLTLAEDSRRFQCEAHFFIGLDHLSRGERDLAKRSFEYSVHVGNYFGVEHMWSKAFLRRMDEDPAWPQWVDLKRP